MGVFNPDQVFAPSRGILGHQASEAGFQLLVKAFSLAVGLRVISRSQAGLGSNESAEFLPESRHKLGPRG